MLGPYGKPQAPKQDNRRKWAGYILVSLIFVGATIGAIMHFENGNSNQSPSHLSEETTQMCDSCNAIPGFDEYQTCNTCHFQEDEDKELSCSSGYGELKITKVRHTSGSDFALIAESCEAQEEEWDSTLGEPFTCSINLAELRLDQGEAEIDFVYEDNSAIDQVVDEPRLSQRGPPRGPPPGEWEPHRGHHHRDGIKIDYICTKLDSEIEEPVMEPAFKLRSVRRVAPEADEPFISSALMHCGKTKTLADTVQVGKVCGADNFELTCDANGDDPRIIILKFKEKGVAHSHKAKKAGKARAKLTTDACVGTGASCNFTPDAFVTESETAADFAGKDFEIKYLCSYGSALAVEAPGNGESQACCKAMTPECMSCAEGITEAEFCGKPENAEVCGESQFMLSSERYEAPSDLLLEAAHVQCGSTRQMSNTVDFGKACADHDFELTCDATRTGARIIVLKMKDTGLEKSLDKAEKKERKKTMKARAAAATDVCDSQREQESCSFSLDDVVDASTDMTSLVDHVFKVKYLCSYDA